MPRKTILHLFILAIFVTSCSKVEVTPLTFPKPFNQLDTNLYPGSWNDYLLGWPVFNEFEQQERHILIEVFTGHQNENSVDAINLANQLKSQEPNRAEVIIVHAGPSPTGITSDQEINSEYPINLTCPEGARYASHYFEHGYTSSPMGSISKLNVSENFYTSHELYDPSFWSEKFDYMLPFSVSTKLKVYSNYFPETKGAFFHVGIESFNVYGAGVNNSKIVGYIVRKEILGKQNINGISTNYLHKDILIGTLNSSFLGREILNDESTKISEVSFSYKLPESLNKEDVYFIFELTSSSNGRLNSQQIIRHEL
jgi:hypothetical protein